MEKQLYPSWRFHATLPACIVNTPEEAAALGEGWEQSPAAFAEPADFSIDFVSPAPDQDDEASEPDTESDEPTPKASRSRSRSRSKPKE